MAVDYDAGASGAIATQYADLRSAIASKGEAENRQKARDIERKGLFGSGIKQSDISDFGNIAIKGAEFGEARMGRKMDRATKSFERRKLADERRIASLKERAKGTSGQVYENLMGEIQGIEMGMIEKRNSFEDYMGKYQEKGLWGTKFGGEDVGYRTEGESKYSQAMRSKPGSGSGDESDWSNLGDLGEGRRSGLPPMRDFERSASQPGGPEFRGGTNIQENAPPEFASRPQGPQLGSAFDRGGEQWSPGVSDSQDSGITDSIRPMSPIEGEGYRSGMMNLGDRGFKKKADLGGQVGTRANPEDTAHIRSQSEFSQPESNKFEQKPSNRYMPGVLRNLTQNQRDRMDVLEKQGLIKEKEQALGQQKTEENQMIQDILNKRRRNKLTEALRETNWK